MKGCLRSKDGSSAHQLGNAVTTIGREASDIILQFPTVEKQHAIIKFDDLQGCFVLEDLNSANGTYVNDLRVQNAAVRLAPGDVIRFGFDNPGYELNVDQIPVFHYPSVTGSNRPWLRVTSSPTQLSSSMSLPYITSGLSSLVDNFPLYQGSQSYSLPGTGVAVQGDMRGIDPRAHGGGSVMPHPPLRSRPASAGTLRGLPTSGGRELQTLPPSVTRGGWADGRGGDKLVNGVQNVHSTEEMEERLLRMGDELSRLASYEAECHRKDGVIQSLRDEVAEFKASRGHVMFRAGGEYSAFSNAGIVTELRQQVSELQAMFKEKDDSHRALTQKLTEYQGQLHIKNEELSSLQGQLNFQAPPVTQVTKDSDATTNTLASLRTEIAEKAHKIAHLSHDLTKANKQKSQTVTLMNTLQRENSSKDGIIQQWKAEVDKLKKQLKEKEAIISTISAKLTRQKATKEAEMEADKREKDLLSSKGKLQSTEKQLKERAKQVVELQNELDRAKQALSEGRQTETGLLSETYRENMLNESASSFVGISADNLDSSREFDNRDAVNSLEAVLALLQLQTEVDEQLDSEIRQDSEREKEKGAEIERLLEFQIETLEAETELETEQEIDEEAEELLVLHRELGRDVGTQINEQDLVQEQAKRLTTDVNEQADSTEQTHAQLVSLALAFAQSDRSIQQELDHAKAQYLDANRAEKLLKVDFQQLEKRFDRFRRKVIQNTFMGSQGKPADRELEDDELVDHIKELNQERLKLVEEIREYAGAEERKQIEKDDLKDAMGVLRKNLENIERRLSRSGRGYKALEQELSQLEEFHSHDLLLWIKDVMCRLLSSEMSWQKRSDETLRRAGVDSDSSEAEGAPTVDDLCRQLKTQRDQCRQLQAKMTEMEETHQDVILKLREDAKREEERQTARAVAETKSVEEEKRHRTIQEMRIKEQDRIQAAVETERRILESQQGSVTQLQQLLNEKQQELENHRSALATAKSQYEQGKERLQRAQEAENQLKVQVHEVVANHRAQVSRLEKEKEEFKNYKQEEVASFKEQTRQHALTIVAMEERLLRLTKHNKQLEQEVAYHSQQLGGRHRPPSPRKEPRPSSPRKEPQVSSRPQSPRKEPKQTRSVETETIPQTSVEAALQSDVYKLEQLVLLLRREACQAKKEAQGQADVVQALRRDLAGASARMSDMTGELSDKQKERLEEYEERIRVQDQELEEQKKQLMQLSVLVDEQQKEIDMREGKLSEQQQSLVRHKQDIAKKGSQLVEFKNTVVEALEGQQAKIEEIEKEKKTAGDVYAQGVRCRGERHEQVIARQKEALTDMRQKAKVMEQLQPPLPSHEQSLQQLVILKKELSGLRASIATREEDYHKSESEIHAELRVCREQSSSNLAEKNFERGSHKETNEALDLSEKTYLKLARTLGSLLEVNPIPGCRSLAHLPAEERERLEHDRTKSVELMVSRVKLMYERLERKQSLLGGYENDLVNLRDSQTVAGLKSAEATGLKNDVRSRQEEIVYLRESLSRLRDELDQQRRLNVCLRERKKFAMDFEDRDSHSSPHSCYMDENSRYKEEARKKKVAEKVKRKNYEIESLKQELRTADRELNDTAIRLQAFETSQEFRNVDGDALEPS